MDQSRSNHTPAEGAQAGSTETKLKVWQIYGMCRSEADVEKQLPAATLQHHPGEERPLVQRLSGIIQRKSAPWSTDRSISKFIPAGRWLH